MLGLGVIGTVIVVSLRKNLVESPRWLEAAGRQDDAVAAVNHVEAVARKEVGGLPKVEDEEIAVQRGKPKFWELLRGPLRKRMIMLWIFHLTQSVGYYGFGSMVPLILAAKGFSLSNNFLVTMLTYIGYPVGSALAIPIMERFQRKHLVVAAASGMVVCGLWFGMSSSWAWIAAAGFCYTIASNVFSNSYHIYESELFPTYVRATATMGVYSVSRLMSAAAPFLLVPLLDNVGVSAALSVVVIAMVVVIVDISILGPRTNGQTVEAIALGRPAREPARDKQAVR
jgi:putative MFS transporter